MTVEVETTSLSIVNSLLDLNGNPPVTQHFGSNHGPVSKDLLFSNCLLMCLAWNYCDSDNSVASPDGERMTEPQEQQLERRVTKLCHVD